VKPDTAQAKHLDGAAGLPISRSQLNDG